MKKLILLMVLSTAPLVAQPIPQATTLFDQGNYDEAKRILSPLVAASDPQALFLSGQIAMAQNDPEKASELFEKATEKKPAASEYHLWLGNAYGSLAMKSNPFKMAMLASKTKGEFVKAVELDPNSIEAHMSLVEYYTLAPSLMGGSGEKARHHATEIRKRDALEGHVAFGRLFQMEKKPDLARKEYADAIREMPASPKAHHYLGIFLFANDKNFKAATAEFETAVKLDPAFMPGWFQIGHMSVMASSNYARGEEALRKYLGHIPKKDDPPLSRAWFWLGGIYEKLGKKAEAKQMYTTAFKMNPSARDVAAALKRVS